MDREQVIARIEDWERRLDALYAQIDDWYRELPPNSIMQSFSGSVLQLGEQLMKQYDVPPRMLSTRAIVYGKNRVSFSPSVLWTIGANGRVNVSTDARRFILVDVGGVDGQPSNWQIVSSQLRNEQRPFDQFVFNNLVLYQAIEAA